MRARINTIPHKSCSFVPVFFLPLPTNAGIEISSGRRPVAVQHKTDGDYSYERFAAVKKNDFKGTMFLFCGVLEK
jgi:hypothetical protein